MQGVILPGNRTVQLKEFEVPEPGHGQVLIKTKASSICGSDIRAIYRAHVGTGPEAYRPGTIAGHEPCGQIERVGPGCRKFKAGDRVVIYHINGCGTCAECRHGYMIGCDSEHREAYGWQRNGGHAPYLLAEEIVCVGLPDGLSYIDGALCACGTATGYEALTRMKVGGEDRLLVTGLGPVGLAAAQLGKAKGAAPIIGIDTSPARRNLAEHLGLCDHTFAADDLALRNILDVTGGRGCEVGIDCIGAPSARLLVLQAARRWGRCAFVGEGGTVSFDVSELLIHKQVTLFGSWVTSLKHLEDLVEHLDRWGVHPEVTCTDRLPLAEAARAYELADRGQSGKVCIVFE